MHAPFPNLATGQVAVAYAEHATGITLSLDGTWNKNPASSPYHIFPTEEAALEAAKSFVERHPKAEAWIYDAKQTTLHRVTSDEPGGSATRLLQATARLALCSILDALAAPCMSSDARR